MSLEKVDLAHFPLTGVSLIEASAGTGKTYAISHLYLRYLLETDYEVGQILVVTFTNAATQELKGRIRDLIYQVRAFLQGAEAEDEQMKRLFSRYRGEQTALEKLQTAIINFDEASIYSIHGFCQRVLTRFPVETGALLQQQLVPDEKALLRSSIHDYWRNKIIALEVVQLHWILNQWRHPDDLLKDVLPVMYQLDDIADMKLLDGESVRYEIEQAWGQLKKAWQDSSEMIKEVLLNNPALRKNSYKPQTIQNLLKELALIFQHPLPYELPKKWNLLSTEKLRASLLKNQNDERIEFPFFRYARDFENLHTHWLRQQRILLLVETAKEVQSQVAVLKTRSLNRSFDDLITDLSEALRYRDQYLVDKITREYPVALVDEFQDTDNRQYFIFSTLYRNQADKSLVLIGDPKQAIYRFRGADVFTYQRARQDTHDHFTLGINYRSSEAYIDVINRLFANNPDAFVLDQLIRFNPVDFDPHTTRIITLSDEPVEPLVAWLHPFNKKPISKTQAAHYFANCCAEEIQKLLAQAELKIDGKSIQARDLAVLVKTGRQATMIKQQLSRRGIGSALVLRDSVFDSPQADDISRLLEVLVDPTDIPTLAGLLSTDIFSWNALQIEQMQQDNETLVDLLEQFKQYQKHSQEKGILSMFFLILQQHNTVQMNYGHMDGERRLTNWLHIVELLQQQSVQHTSLSQSLTWLNQQRQDMQANGDNEEHQLRLESDSNLVRIVTIHKSKGLEYPIVFLPFMWDVKSAINQPRTYTVHDDAGNKKLQLYDEGLRERWHEENLA
ncbi:MAG: UvrD-helicase domain-containing protein, partial [Gammaproteobacteria bacterium]|nr:UvrD-helicase domain-containing protein [Gammaproteobacteria bacterium]